MHNIPNIAFAAIVAITPVIAGCEAEKLSEPARLGELSRDDSVKLAETIRVAMEVCDLPALRGAFDIDATLRRGLLSSSLSTRSQRWFYDQMQGPAMSQRWLCVSLDSNLTLLSIRNFPVSGQSSALFRVDFRESGGFDYIEVLMGQSREGRAIADDMYVYSGGWLLSEQFRDSSVAVASDYYHSDEFRDTRELLATNPAAGLTAVELLSPGFRASKALMLEMVRASADVGPESYARTIEEFSDKFPGDASLHFITLDGLYIQERWDQLMTTIDKLEQSIGEDPSLDEFRLGILMQAKYFERARGLVTKRIAGDPADEEWPQIGVDVELEAQNYPAALVRMKHIADSQGTVWGEELVADDMYPEFGQSKEWKLYNEWLIENDYSMVEEAVEEPFKLEDALKTEEALPGQEESE